MDRYGYCRRINTDKIPKALFSLGGFFVRIDKEKSSCGYRIMVIPQLSKLMPGVRFSLPAPAFAKASAGLRQLQEEGLSKIVIFSTTGEGCPTKPWRSRTSRPTYVTKIKVR